MAGEQGVNQMAGFVLRRRRHLPWLYGMLVVLSVLLAGVWWLMVVGDGQQDRVLDRLRDILLTSIAGLGALLFYVYQQHREETRLFVELFNGFNARYDKLNARLNGIAQRLRAQPGSLLEEDYFNLCAEEYLFARSGYLDEDVLRAWRAGMRHFRKVERIRELWESEIRQGSYYGFTLSLLDVD